MGIPLPALAIQQPPSPLDVYGRVASLQDLAARQQLTQQQTQGAQLQNQMTQQQLNDSKIMSQAFIHNNGDLDKTIEEAARNGASFSAVLAARTHDLTMKNTASTLLKSELENAQTQNDAVLEAHKAVDAVAPEQKPTMYQQQLGNLHSMGIDVSKFPQQYPGDDQFKLFGAGLTGTASRLQAEARMAAATKTPEQDLPLGAKVGQLNQMLNSRYQVLNPGKSLPPEFSLSANATQKDFDRIDKTLQQTEQAQGTKAQQDEANSFRRFALQLASQRPEQEQEMQLQKKGTEDLNKIWSDPQHGYGQFLAQADLTKKTIQAAQNGDQLAASFEPLMTVLGVNSFAGVHRINPVEYEKAGPGMGSLFRQTQALFDRVGSGTIPPQTLAEANGLIDRMIATKHDATLQASKMVAANSQLDPARAYVLDRDGNVDTLENVQKTTKAPAKTSQQTGGFTVGQKVTLKGGKTVTITAVHPDGTFDAK